jgi:hypothetical protein
MNMTPDNTDNIVALALGGPFAGGDAMQMRQ